MSLTATASPWGAMVDHWELAREWISSADALETAVPDTAAHILGELAGRSAVAPARNSVRAEPVAGDEPLARCEAYVRWNAAMCVQHANTVSDGLGGHLSTFASTSTLFAVAWDHFLRGRTHPSGGDHVYFQGHASPGVYARAYCEGRIDEQQLRLFRQEIAGGLPSYPHPRLMPDFWEYPTVSMGLGPSSAVAQALVDKYLTARGLRPATDQRVWAFLGDGECDEPETLGLIRNAARWGLDNLVFVISCNLQRLDGPAAGSASTIGELRGLFTGAGWKVIDCLWGEKWEPLFDKAPALAWHLATLTDGDLQRLASGATAAEVRNELLGEWAWLVDGWDDRSIEALASDVGGASRAMVHASYSAALHAGRPAVVLARTIKGHLFPHAGRNAAHQIKKLTATDLHAFADRLGLALDDDQRAEVERGGAVFLRPDDEVTARLAHVAAERGHVPTRRTGVTTSFALPFAELDEPSTKPVSTTAVLTRALKTAVSDRCVVPIVADEGRTFGFDPLYSQVGVYSPTVAYTAVDAALPLRYREDPAGAFLQAGISEATAMAFFQAAGTSHATHGLGTVGWYTFYSMFGLQRVGDQIWQCVDARARGLLVGATAGRTTLNGEGLQHQDGHSLAWAMNVPHLNAYDCAFAYEIGDVLRWQFARWDAGTEELCYLTAYNEAWAQPGRPATCQAEDVIAGAYIFAEPLETSDRVRPSVVLAFSGPAWQAAAGARDQLAEVGVDATLVSVVSYKQLWLDILDCQRRSIATGVPSVPHLARLVDGRGPVVFVSDWSTTPALTVASCVEDRVAFLGTDGLGRSDTRERLREHFAVTADDIVAVALDSVSRRGLSPAGVETLAALRGRFNSQGSWRQDA